jgi:hypothetical protein
MGYEWKASDFGPVWGNYDVGCLPTKDKGLGLREIL